MRLCHCVRAGTHYLALTCELRIDEVLTTTGPVYGNPQGEEHRRGQVGAPQDACERPRESRRTGRLPFLASRRARGSILRISGGLPGCIGADTGAVTQYLVFAISVRSDRFA